MRPPKNFSLNCILCRVRAEAKERVEDEYVIQHKTNRLTSGFLQEHGRIPFNLNAWKHKIYLSYI
jgi:hypothetical protein